MKVVVKVKSNIKRIFLGILAIAVVVALIVLIVRKRDYDEISYEEFQTMISEERDFVLVVGSSTCTHCKEYHETMRRVIREYQLDIKYINVHNLSDEEKNQFKTVINYSGTPTTVFITKGKEESTYNRIDGAKSYDKIISKLKKNGIIKEGEK